MSPASTAAAKMRLDSSISTMFDARSRRATNPLCAAWASARTVCRIVRATVDAMAFAPMSFKARGRNVFVLLAAACFVSPASTPFGNMVNQALLKPGGGRSRRQRRR